MEDIESLSQFTPFSSLGGIWEWEGVETKDNQIGVENGSSLWSFPDQKPLPMSLSPNGGLSLMALKQNNR
jgi:hypothetical protein